MRSVAMAATVLTFCAGPSFAEEVCRLKRYAVVPFAMDDTSHVYLPATLASQQTRLMLDTGAFWSLIREDLVEKLDLKTRRSEYLILVDLSGEKINRITQVPEVKIGGLNFGAAEFFVAGAGGQTPVEEDGGVLGLNLLTNVDIEIDNAARTISFFSQDHCPGDGVHWADEAVTLKYKIGVRTPSTGTRVRRESDKEKINEPVVLADLEGEQVSVLFDTGATSTSIDLDVAKRRFGIGPGSPGVQPANKVYVGSGKEVDTYSYTFKSLTIGGIKFENVPVRLGDFEDISQVILGMNEMKHLHLYFSFKEGLIHVTAADAKRTPEAGKPQ